jgi:uncharacterized integral membrane protein (TIGR00697 family)
VSSTDSAAFPSGRTLLAALFVTSLVVGQLLAVKILAIPLPVSLPAAGSTIIVPAGVLAYALTFFASDCYAELYGRRAAQSVVNAGFLMIFAMLALLWLAILAPGSPAGADPAAFARVLAPGTNIVVGSLCAYLLSQHWDVFAFHAIREYTGGEHLWARNVGSTATSQAIDTVVFIVVGFVLAPAVLGIGQPSSIPFVVSLVVGQYLFKLLIALLDTPFVYAVVGAVRNREFAGAAAD